MVTAPAAAERGGLAERAGSAEGTRAFLRRFGRSRTAALGVVIVGLVLLGALGAPWLAPHDPLATRAVDALQPPSARYWLGTDDIGRDILSRIIYGSRVSLYVGAISITIAAGLGVTLGLVAGYYGRLVDGFVMRFLDALLAFPAILKAIFIMAVLGPSIQNAMIAIGIIYTPAFARIVRANVLSLKQKEFVEAGRAIGAGDLRLMFRTLLPNCLSPLIVQASLGVGYAVLVESGLSFLGLGTQPPEPSWGSMLSAGRSFLSLAPWYATFPGLAIFITVLGLNFVGDGLREALDPHLRHGH